MSSTRFSLYLLAAMPALAAASLAALVPAEASDSPTPKNYCEDPSEWGNHAYVGSGVGGIGWIGGTGLVLFAGTHLSGMVFDGNISGDCNGDTVPADYDGHLEWGLGGIILTVAAEDPAYPGCAIETAHHADATVYVEDRVLGFGVNFGVGADYDCDGVSDQGITCMGSCDPPFDPGADGALWVFLDPAFKGHVWTA